MNNFYYTFPAIRGIQAQNNYYVIMCPLSVLTKLFVFNEDENILPEYRAQRTLNKTRIPEIAEYIINNPKSYVFSSLTASIDGKINFIVYPDSISNDIGLLQVSMDSRLLINDGQHRRFAIEEAIKVNPDLSNETISIVLFVDKNLEKSQQIFSDLNKHAINISKSIGILYDSRDKIAILTKEIVDNVEYLKTNTDMENSNLSKFSTKLFTLNNIYETNKKIIGKNSLDTDKLQTFIFEFWDYLVHNFKEWNLVFTKCTNPFNSRNSSVSSYGIVLIALGIIGNYIFSNNIASWNKYLDNLNSIDWSRTNKEDWLGRAFFQNGRITKNVHCIKLTSILIKNKIGLPLTSEENKLELNFRKE